MAVAVTRFRLSYAVAATAKVKTWRLTKFTLDESKEYLKDVVSDPKVIQELHQTFKGRPGSLAVVHRLLSAGTTPQQLLANTEGDLGSLLEREWSSVGTLSEADLQVLGLLVFARTALTSSDIARVLHVRQDSVDALVRRIPFVHTDSATRVITVVGETMRRFVLRKTERFKRDLLDALIKDLQDNPSVRESLSALPRYFQDAGRLQELVTYLTPNRLSESLRNAETLSPLSETLAAGLEAAAKLKRDGDSYRFSLQTSAVAEIGSAASWDSQASAVLALGDFDQAIQIAESVPLAKDKLLLLASVASAQRIDGLSPSDALIERIRRLLDDVADSTRQTASGRGLFVGEQGVVSDRRNGWTRPGPTRTDPPRPVQVCHPVGHADGGVRRRVAPNRPEDRDSASSRSLRESGAGRRRCRPVGLTEHRCAGRAAGPRSEEPRSPPRS